MGLVVEAYAAESDRLLWRSKGLDDDAAYDLAVSVDADPRIEVLLLHIDDDDGTQSVLVVDSTSDRPA